MDRFKETLIFIDSDKLSIKQLVSIMILIVSKLNINTISEMARENKLNGEKPGTPRGIRISPNYQKLDIGKQLFSVKGAENNEFPF